VSSLGDKRRWKFFAVAALSLTALASGPSLRASTNSAASPPQPTNAAASLREVAGGKAVFDQSCAICHFSESTAQKIGPGLKNLYTRLRFADGKRVDDVTVTHWIESGGKNMPGFKDALKPAQIHALIAYLKTL